MKIFFVRHLKTKGNYEKRYIGITDERLINVHYQKNRDYLPEIDKLYSSPMLRCLMTASLLYPDMEPVIVENLREMDFGRFENKTYEELKDDEDYIRFINGSDHIPDGDSVKAFKNRCIEAFYRIVEQNDIDATVMIVCHGGTIMSILEHFDRGSKGFYGYQVKNGCGYEAEYDKNLGKMKILREFS